MQPFFHVVLQSAWRSYALWNENGNICSRRCQYDSSYLSDPYYRNISAYSPTGTGHTPDDLNLNQHLNLSVSMIDVTLVKIQTRCYLNHPARYTGNQLIHTHYQDEFLIHAPTYLHMSHTSLQVCVSIHRNKCSKKHSKYQDHLNRCCCWLHTHTSNYTEVKWNANLMQLGNFIDVFLAWHVSGTYAHHQEH